MYILTVILLVYFFSIVIIRLRCKNFFKLRKQLSDFSVFMVPFNLPAYLLSKVPTTSKISAEYFPELNELENNWETIRDEALQLFENGYISIKEDLPASSFYKDGRWTSFYLKVYDCDIPSARELAPKTMELLNRIPNINLALFACLNPGRKLKDHHDPFAYTVRYSLGLSTPNSDKCAIVVDGDSYTWEDGKGILFDETFLHSTHNETDKPRIILMTDVDRPLKSTFIQKLYFMFGRFFNSFFYIDNVDSKKSGFGNKITPYLNKYRKFQKNLKHNHNSVYKLVKLGLLIFFIFIIYIILF